MNFNFDKLNPIIALVVGILILLFPQLLSILVAVYLIIVGISGLIGRR